MNVVDFIKGLLSLKTDKEGNASGYLKKGTRNIDIKYSNHVKKYQLVIGDDPVPTQMIEIPQSIATITVTDSEQKIVSGADVFVEFNSEVVFSGKTGTDGTEKYHAINIVQDDGSEKEYTFYAKKDGIFSEKIKQKIYCPEGANVQLSLKYENIVSFHAKDIVDNSPIQGVTISIDDGIIVYTDEKGNFTTSSQKGEHKCKVSFEGNVAEGKFVVDDYGANIEITLGRSDADCRQYAVDNFGNEFGGKLSMSVSAIIETINNFVKKSDFEEAVKKLLPRPETPAKKMMLVYDSKGNVGLQDIPGNITDIVFEVPQAETGKSYAYENELIAKYECTATILEEVEEGTYIYAIAGMISRAPRGDYDVYFSNDNRVNVDVHQQGKKTGDKTNIKLVVHVLPVERKKSQTAEAEK